MEFRSHPIYRLEGGDIHLDLPVAPWEAALGATVPVSTPAGTVELKVPVGSDAGRKLRLKGRGLPGRQPGDLYVTLQVVLPPADSPEAKALYEKMRDELAFDPRARRHAKT